MPNTNSIRQGQSFIDICIQETGSVENVVKMAVLNNRSITDGCPVGDVYKRPAITKADVVSFMTPEAMKPATEWQWSSLVPEPEEGISFWEIGKEFEITAE